MNISSKVFIVLLLLVIINILLYIYLTSNKAPRPQPKEITITDSNLKGNEYEFNMYYTYECPWSRRALPDFSKLKDWIDDNKNSIGKNKIHIHIIDIDKVHKIADYKTKKQIQKDIKQIGINESPMIVLFNGKSRLIEQYDGERTLKAYKKWLKNLK